MSTFSLQLSLSIEEAILLKASSCLKHILLNTLSPILWLHFHEQYIEPTLKSQLFVEIPDCQWNLVSIIQFDSTNPYGAVTVARSHANER